MRIIGEIAERRGEPRIHLPFFARVRGVDAEGRSFAVDAIVDNLSSGGFFLQVPFRVNTGDKLSTVIRLSISPVGDAVRVAAQGLVLRVEPKPDEMYGLAVSFIQYRCL